MQLIKILYLVLIISSPIFSQINGSFLFGIDNNYNYYAYFKANNVTGYNQDVKIMAVNEYLGEKKEWTVSLRSNEYFTIGPEDGWYWQSGEKIFITYPDGKTFYWTYVPQQQYSNNSDFMNSDIMTPDWMKNKQNSTNSSSNTFICPSCRGTGICQFCNSSGQYNACVNDMFGNNCEDPECIAKNHRCRECGGNHVCDICNGKGMK